MDPPTPPLSLSLPSLSLSLSLRHSHWHLLGAGTTATGVFARNALLCNWQLVIALTPSPSLLGLRSLPPCSWAAFALERHIACQGRQLPLARPAMLWTYYECNTRNHCAVCVVLGGSRSTDEGVRSSLSHSREKPAAATADTPLSPLGMFSALLHLAARGLSGLLGPRDGGAGMESILSEALWETGRLCCTELIKCPSKEP